MLQAVISRMAQNSFAIKGYTVLLLAGLFSVGAAAETNATFALLAYMPTMAFWLLDAYFLRQERLFRSLYDAVRKRASGAVDFSMSTAPFSADVASLPRVLVTPVLIAFYGAACISIAIVAIGSNS